MEHNKQVLNSAAQDQRQRQGQWALGDNSGSIRPALDQAPVNQPLRAPSECVSVMRKRLHAERRELNCRELEQFLTDVFSDDLIVESYFIPYVCAESAPRVRRASEPLQAAVTCLPWTAVLEGAERRWCSMRASEFERELVYAVTLVAPCAQFYLAHPYVQAGQLGEAVPKVNEVRLWLLERDAHALRVRNPALGGLISQLLSLNCDD
jgi:hypothetical protein